MTSNTSAELYNRQNYPPPGSFQPPNNGARPPRKSSLGQQDAPPPSSAPYIPTLAQSPQEPDLQATSFRDRSDSNKSLPFVRPADIYKRLQEEREKERLSQESSRPSLDALGVNKSVREESPSKSGDDSDGFRSRKTALATVAERKSEHLLEGFPSPKKITADEVPPKSGSPQLPEILGLSDGFGSEFGSGFGDSLLDPIGKEGSSPGLDRDPRPVLTLNSQTVSSFEDKKSILQHQPSQGLRSVVNQAFDQPAVPPTPSSASGSVIARSNSGGTSVISPIISRNPSDARPKEADAKEAGAQFSPIAEESASSPIVTQVKEGAAQETLDQNQSSQVPPSFVPGYRREMSPPSPENSPARTTVVEVNNTLNQPREVEIAQTTPGMTPSNSSAGMSNRNQSDDKDDSNPSPERSSPKEPAQILRQTSTTTAPLPASVTGSIASSSASMGKGRVRDIADKYDDIHNSVAASLSLHSSGSLRSPQMPEADRAESSEPRTSSGEHSYSSNSPQNDMAETQYSESSVPIDSAAEVAVAATAVVAPSAAVVAMNAPISPVEHVTGLDRDLGENSPDTTGPATQDHTQHVSPTGPVMDHEQNEYLPASQHDMQPEAQASQSLLPAKDEDSASSIVPTPFGMGDGRDLSKAAQYFPQQPPPLTPDHLALNKNKQLPPVQTPDRPPAHLNLSTESSPSDEESDRLRKQIVRELSPQHEEHPFAFSSVETSQAGSGVPPPNPSHSLNSEYSGMPPQNPSHGLNSEYSGMPPRDPSHGLNSEYESYWNDSFNPETVALRDFSSGNSIKADPEPTLDGMTQPSASASTQPSQGNHVLAHRFSWEPIPENIGPKEPQFVPTGAVKENISPRHC